MTEPPAGDPPQDATPPAPPDEAAASAAAAALARRRHEVEAAREAGDAPCRMVDLHDVRTELLAELRRAGAPARVPHAVPAAPASDAQPAARKRWPAVLALALVVAVVALVVLARRRRP